MIIKTYETEKIKNISSKVTLLYGENDGFKNQVFKDFFAINFQGKIDRIEENEIFNNSCLNSPQDISKIAHFPFLPHE